MHFSHPPEPTADRVRLREEHSADAAGLYEMHCQAFGRPDEAELVNRLRRACPKRISLVADVSSRIVGHVLLTPVELDADPHRMEGLGLGPVGVLPKFQRQGIGARLVRQGLEASRQSGAPFVVVLGEPAYYGRFGFVPARGRGIGCKFEGVPDDAFMIIALDPAALAGVSGVARYHPEFHSVA